MSTDPYAQPVTLRPQLDRRHLPDGAPIVVACSGGSDSMALLHLVAEAAPEAGWSVTVAHLDHALRDDSAADTVFVQESAARLGFRCLSTRREVRRETRPGEGPEGAARRVRYTFLLGVLEQLGAQALILTGHTADDQAETLLMREARGSGLRGLRGILPRRQDGVVRPLLHERRERLRAWLREQGIGWREDPSNDDATIPRNALRQRISRLAETRRDDLVGAALEATGYSQQIFPLLGRLAACWVRATTAEAVRALPGNLSGAGGPAALWPGEFVLVAPPGGFHLSLLGHILLDTAVEGLGADPRVITRRARADLFSDTVSDPGAGNGAARAGGGRGLTQLAEDLWCERVGPGLLLSRGSHPDWSEKGAPTFFLEPPQSGAGIRGRLARGGTLTIRPAMADELNMDGDVPLHEDLGSTRLVLGGELAAGGLTVRYAREGDTIRPFGMAGRKALSDLFGECGVPRLRRARLPVIEAGGEIVWVAGVRAAESSRLPPKADRGCVLELER